MGELTEISKSLSVSPLSPALPGAGPHTTYSCPARRPFTRFDHTSCKHPYPQPLSLNEGVKSLGQFTNDAITTENHF